jgi:hypothetical protein
MNDCKSIETDQNIDHAFKNNVAGWSHWWCTWSGATDASLVRVVGTSYYVAARLWAFAGYFRFARPGAVRVSAESNVQEVRVTAWVNANGTVSIVSLRAPMAQYTFYLNLSSPSSTAPTTTTSSVSSCSVSMSPRLQLTLPTTPTMSPGSPTSSSLMASSPPWSSLAA